MAGEKRDWRGTRQAYLQRTSFYILLAVVTIAIIQGTIGGVAFWALGVDAAMLWGVTMTFLSMLPASGAALVWGPAAIWLVLTGAWLKAAIWSSSASSLSG